MLRKNFALLLENVLRGRLRLLAWAVLLCVLAAGSAAWWARRARAQDDAPAAVLTVTKIADTNDGVCNADCSLREAIAAAAPGDLINFSSLFNTTQTITLNGTELAINQNLTINGPGANLLTVSGNNASRVFNIGNGFTVTLSGMTITGGNDVSGGGGILNNGALTVFSCHITGNSAPFGGGIRNSISNTTLILLNSTVSNNAASATFGTGGGIDSFGVLTVTNSTISGNSAPSGNFNGGGIWAGGLATITNSTITNNSAAGANSASGVFRNIETVTIRNSIIAGNVNNATTPDVFANNGTGINSNGYNLIGNRGSVSFSATGDQSSTGAFPLNPRLGPLTNNGGPTPTHPMSFGSPALDAGNSSGVNNDQRGLNRPFDVPGISPATGGDNADIGAFETQAFIVTNANDSGAGSLRQAIADAPTNSDILFDPSFFNVARAIMLTSGQLALSKSLTIQGPGANLLTVSGNNASRVFNIGNGFTVTLSGMTITGGNATSSSGGGINNGGSAVTVTDCVISGNTTSAGSGGGIRAFSGTTSIIRSNITGNTATSGGGIMNVSLSALTLFNSTVSNNTATSGGGGIDNSGIITVINSTISGNSTNSAPNGSDNGGGIRNLNAIATITNSTITNNTATGANSAGGVVTAPGLTIRNSIIAGNNNASMPDVLAGSASVISNGYNLIGNRGNITFGGAGDQSGTGASPLNPFLGPLANNGGPTPTHALLVGSTALDAGNNTGSGVNTDQRGLTRPFDAPGIGNVGDGADIGAFETQAFIVTNANDSGAGSLRQVIAAAPANSDILFDPTFFNVPRALTLGGTELAISKSLTIQGPGANLLTVSGNNQSRVFNIGAGFTVNLSGMTITGGNAGNLDGGGGIVNNGALTVFSCHITGNTAGFGGGISGGGVLTLLRSTVSNNTATTFRSTGGGISGLVALTVTNSTISGNSVPFGNANGGGIRTAGTVTITNSTITNNSIGGVNGAGGFFRDIGMVTITNSVIAGNVNNATTPDVTSSDGTGIISGGFNLIGNRGALIFGGAGDQAGGNGNPVINPQLGPLANNGGPTPTHALLVGSTALDGGNNTGSGVATDQRGAAFNRVVDLPDINNVGDGADIGAYEAQTAPVQQATRLSIVAPAIATNGTAFNFTVTALDAANNTVTGYRGSVHFTSTSGGTLPVDYTFTAADNGARAFSATLTTAGNQTITATDAANSLSGTSGAITVSAAIPSILQFSAANFTVNERAAFANVTISRTGDSSGMSGVDYKTNDSFAFADCAAPSLTADQRCDYAAAQGALNFTAGETSKTFTILLTDDFYPENNETLSLILSNPTGGTLGANSTATLTISDDDTTAPAERLFFASLNAAQEVPTNNSAATGSGTVLLNAAETQITANLSFNGLSSAQTAAHIHGAAHPGVNGPVLFDLGTGTITNLNFVVTPTQVAQLKAGLFYLNVHTMNFSGGEIRGQLLPNPAENARFFVRQQYHDFLSRVPDQAGEDFWTGQIATVAGTDLNLIKQRRVAVSNAFFFEQEYQSTGAYTFRLYREAFGNIQPFQNTMGDMDSNPYCQANPNNCQLIRASHVPSYEKFAGDRARLNPSQLASSQLALATQFAQRAEFVARYPLSQSAEQYVDALIANILAADGANLSGQRSALIALFNSGGRGAVLFRLAEDNLTGNPINNRPFIDAEYNRSFVTTQYFGYLRRDADLPGLNFWLSVVNQFPLRSPVGQNGMVCAFITSGEYQQRFNSYFTRTNQTDCP